MLDTPSSIFKVLIPMQLAKAALRMFIILPPINKSLIISPFTQSGFLYGAECLLATLKSTEHQFSVFEISIPLSEEHPEKTS